MWFNISRAILKFRIQILVLVLLLTLVMGYFAFRVQMSFEIARVLPAGDSTFVTYQKFKSLFGEDGNVLVLGVQDEDLFKLEKFNAWYDLAKSIENVEGIKSVTSLGSLIYANRDDSTRTIDVKPIFSHKPQTQSELDSLKDLLFSIPTYKNLVYNPDDYSTVMAVTFKKEYLNSARRAGMVSEIKALGEQFEKDQGVDVYFSGMPYVRSEYMKIVSEEMKLFLILAVLVTSVILFLFFKSFSIVFFTMLIVGIEVVWSIGLIELFGYKISILSGLVAPIIIVIGIPNCVFLINKYQSEYAKSRKKGEALLKMVDRIGLTLLLANITTAIGFGVFYFTGSVLLTEFGVIAAINVMLTFILTLVMVPIVFSFLPAPSLTKVEHLSGKRITKILSIVDTLVHNHRVAVYTITAILTVISLYGITQIKLIGFVVDDLPKNHPIFSDLKFFETKFHGVLPFDVFVDTKKPNGVFADNAVVLSKIQNLQKRLAKYPELSKPLSVVEGVKFSYQAFRGGDSKYYVLPPPMEMKKMLPYLYKDSSNADMGRLSGVVDTTRTYTRISYQVADVGSVRMKEMVAEIKPMVDSIFPPSTYNVELTGHSLVFLKNNDYLLKNLFESLLIEIVLIALIGMVLFRSVRIIILSKLPCIIPLILTAGIMGFAGIEFKASTILIFTIAFGLASDGTIYFLTKYRHELRKPDATIGSSITSTIKETGISMVYTTMILFFGFIIFASSSFGGTIALGLLVSVTLFVSLITNLVLLPSILISIGKKSVQKELTEESLLEVDDEEEEKV